MAYTSGWHRMARLLVHLHPEFYAKTHGHIPAGILEWMQIRSQEYMDFMEQQQQRHGTPFRQTSWWAQAPPQPVLQRAAGVATDAFGAAPHPSSQEAQTLAGTKRRSMESPTATAGTPGLACMQAPLEQPQAQAQVQSPYGPPEYQWAAQQQQQQQQQDRAAKRTRASYDSTGLSTMPPPRVQQVQAQAQDQHQVSVFDDDFIAAALELMGEWFCNRRGSSTSASRAGSPVKPAGSPGGEAAAPASAAQCLPQQQQACEAEELFLSPSIDDPHIKALLELEPFDSMASWGALEDANEALLMPADLHLFD